jgi:hypothetical protein
LVNNNFLTGIARHILCLGVKHLLNKKENQLSRGDRNFQLMLKNYNYSMELLVVRITLLTLKLVSFSLFLIPFLVNNEIEMLSGGGSPFFNPKFTHQVFHRDETIKGMKDLSVTIYFSPTTFRPYVYWICSDYGRQYDDLNNIFKYIFGEDVLLFDRAQFLEVLK